ncbi:MAG: hypothetical protein ABWZ79_07080 [Pedobacter agri]|uniref:hypothetical protein n=1 Tax=Pedobacter agri TaxID=454586 RepID=UPI0027845807|nr:hypothetical protein [Pedobacter agri]MDQ1142667.1 hypothetical protein [Pedobacter agri]
MKTLILNRKSYGDQLFSDGVQRLDFTTGFPVANYDFGGFLMRNFPPQDLTAVQSALSKTILFKAATTNFLGVPIKSFSGLTCYIPSANDTQLTYYK